MKMEENMKKGKGERFKRVLLAIGIAIILSAFAGFFALELSNRMAPGKLEDCWRGCEEAQDLYSECTDQSTITECQSEYSAWRDCNDECLKILKPKLKIFAITTIIMGVIAIIVGVFLGGMSAVSGGLIGGGIISLLEGIMAYWSQFEGWLRVIILAGVLGLLIVIGIKKLKD